MLFYKEYALRRFEPSVYVMGHSTSSFADKPLHADIQTLQNISTTGESGAYSKQRIKVFSKERIQIADKKNGIRADWVYFQEKWFEAVSCRLSENTLLKHYTSEFEEILSGDADSYLQPPVIKKEEEEETEDTGETEESEEGNS